MRRKGKEARQPVASPAGHGTALQARPAHKRDSGQRGGAPPRLSWMARPRCESAMARRAKDRCRMSATLSLPSLTAAERERSLGWGREGGGQEAAHGGEWAGRHGRCGDGLWHALLSPGHAAQLTRP